MIQALKYTIYLILTILALNFYLRDLGLENINEDQYRWYDRTEDFFLAIQNKDYAGTYQQYHPGISFIYFLKLGYLSFEIITKNTVNDYRDVSPELFPTFNFHTKIFIVTFILISILLLTWIIKEIYGKFIAIIFFTILTFDTYFIGLTRNLHMDSLLAIQLSIVLASFYKYNQSNEKRFILISIFYFGFGLLTKSVFLIIFPFLFFITIYFAFIKKNYLKSLINLGTVLIGGFFIFTLLFPSMWVNPSETLSKIFFEGALNTGLRGEDNFLHYVNNYELTNPGPKFYAHVLSFRLSNLILFSILTIFIFYVYKFIKYKKLEIKHDFLIISLIILVVTYLSIITYSSKKTDRYISLILPPIAIICSFYIREIWVKTKEIYFKILFILFIFITLIINFFIHPFYFAFYNPVLGGINQAQKRIYINQGGIAYLEIIKELENFPTYNLSAYNFEELKYSSKRQIQPINYFNSKEPNFVRVLTLQRGNNLTKSYKFVKNVNILYQPFWRIYIQN
jgi:hypothetical protein